MGRFPLRNICLQYWCNFLHLFASILDVPQMRSKRRSAKKHSTSTFHVESSAADDPTPSTSATPDVQSLEPPSKKKSSVEKNTASSGTSMRKWDGF